MNTHTVILSGIVVVESQNMKSAEAACIKVDTVNMSHSSLKRDIRSHCQHQYMEDSLQSNLLIYLTSLMSANGNYHELKLER